MAYNSSHTGAQIDSAVGAVIEKEAAWDSKGAGDMLASVYDPNGKAQDVFQYADAKAGEAKSAADTALTNAKKYTDQKIAAIPTPDVSGQIETHNTAENAHSALFAKKQDKLTPGTDYATPEQVNALKAKAHKVSLTVAGWDGSTKQQTVSVADVVADETAQQIIPMPAAASMTAYNDAGIQCTAQAAGKLTFTADTVPTASIDVYVTVTPVAFS